MDAFNNTLALLKVGITRSYAAAVTGFQFLSGGNQFYYTYSGFTLSYLQNSGLACVKVTNSVATTMSGSFPNPTSHE